MEAGIIENLGAYSHTLPAGLNFVKWPFENIVAKISLKVQKLLVSCDTKTKDNVFVRVQVAGNKAIMFFCR